MIPEGGALADCRIAEDEERTAACVSVKNANAVTIVLAAATSFVKWNAEPNADPARIVAQRMAAARTPVSPTCGHAT